jgi:hypothetical protein
MSSRIYDAEGYPQAGFAIYLALVACTTLDEKWVQREKYPNNTCLPYRKISQEDSNFQSPLGE